MPKQAFQPDAFQNDAFQVQISDFGYAMPFVIKDETLFIVAESLTLHAYAKDETQRAVAVIAPGAT